MPSRALLIGGVASLVVGLVGMAVSSGSGAGWSYHPHGTMMGWRVDDSGPLPPRIRGGEQIEVQAGEFVFDPSRIEITAGEPVNIGLSNRGALIHDFTIVELDFQLRANAGRRSTGGLEVTDAGRYRFECTIPGHAQAGMVGTLVVND
ncbi:MAG: cupredoxin domain-containing protein [Actinomycetota bacterium]